MVVLPERTPVPDFDLVIFGASGDLALRKLFPAVARRQSEGVIPPTSRVIGVVRSGTVEEHTAKVAEWLASDGLTAAEIADFMPHLSFATVDANNPSSYADLVAALGESTRSRAFYLSTPPSLFIPICRNLAAAGLLRDDARVVLEKPLGTDLRSARAINEAVAQILPESRTYRIDHYLGKETVQNLLVLRFANTLFERSWSYRDVDHVQITCAETVGLESRAGYYDGVGALRDMVQNHVLQLLCLFALEPPNTLDADAVRDEKVRILRALRPISGTEVLQRTVRGQYAAGSALGAPAPSYAEELGRDSNTETFAALRCELGTWRWAGVPIYLRTGKRMAERRSEIVVTFKPVPHSIFRGFDAQSGLAPNRLVIRLQPNEGVTLQMMMKVPGSGRLKIVPRSLDLKYETAFQGRSPEAYERLLTDVIRGDQTLFMRRDEVEAAWGWIDPILDGWREHYPVPHRYTAGSWGPSHSVGLIEREGRSWVDHEDLR
jgi:glucose-6-phosphate 1-dehydrogenase